MKCSGFLSELQRLLFQIFAQAVSGGFLAVKMYILEVFEELLWDLQ
jgi:hypothetical protein